jgi:hypothetical protein
MVCERRIAQEFGFGLAVLPGRRPRSGKTCCFSLLVVGVMRLGDQRKTWVRGSCVSNSVSDLQQAPTGYNIFFLPTQ